MDITTTKILVLAIVGLLILATLYGELRPRRRPSRDEGGARWSRS